MYSFLQLVDYFFNTTLENSQFIKYVQNAHTLIVSIGCGVGLYYYQPYSSLYIIPFLQKTILAQCTFDLFLNSKPDIFIHHIIAISMVAYSLSQPSQIYKSAVIISSELSSIFLVFNHYLDHESMLSVMNKCCFLSTFFYTRLYLYTKEILFDETFVIGPHPNKLWYSVNIYSFLCINIYWGSILVKIMYKKMRKLVKPYHTKVNTEYLCQMTLFIQPCISGYLYYCNDYYTVSSLMDMTSLVAISISSYKYHNALLCSSSMNVLDDSIFSYYLSDIAAIHLRSFLIVSVSLLRFLQELQLKCIVITNIALFHIIVLHMFYDHHQIKKLRKKTIIYDEHESLVSLYAKVPLIIDVCIIVYSCSNAIVQNHMILANLLILATLVMKPFYEMNHFFFHLFLIYQSIAVTQGIIN